MVQIIEQNGLAVVSSRVVAEDFGKQHKHVLEAIENLIKDMGVAENSANLFIESKYQHPQNKQWYKEYLLTRDGFSLLVMGFTGKEALQWKLQYIEAFNQMEEMIKQQNDPFAGMSNELKAIFILDKKQQEFDHRLADLENNMTIDYSQQEELKVLVGRCVDKLLGTASENQFLRRKLYSAIYRALQTKFKVNSYRNLAVKHYGEARMFVEAWEPKELLALAIGGAQSQMNLNLEEKK